MGSLTLLWGGSGEFNIVVGWGGGGGGSLESLWGSGEFNIGVWEWGV